MNNNAQICIKMKTNGIVSSHLSKEGSPEHIKTD